MSALAKESARAMARTKKKAKTRGRLATIAVSKDTLYESVQLPKGKEKSIIGSCRILWKRWYVRHRTGRFVQFSTAGLRQHHAVAA